MEGDDRITSGRICGAAALAVVLLWPGAAAGKTPPERAATAQGLYEAAVPLLEQGQYELACPKLEESNRLDPAMGTQFFLAHCYENTGRPVSAWSLFQDVAAAARAAGNRTREATARERAALLEARLPRITIVVPAAVAVTSKIEITRNGAEVKPIVWGSAVPVDLGAYVVRAAAPGKIPWETTVRIEQLGDRAEVEVPPLRDAAGPPPIATPRAIPRSREGADSPNGHEEGPAVLAPARLGAQKIAAITAGAAGVAGLAAGSVLGGLAASTWSDAQAACPTRVRCSAEAHDRSKTALDLAAGSTIAFAAGGALLTAGAILWLTAPAPRDTARLRLAPVLGPSAAGLWLTGEM